VDDRHYYSELAAAYVRGALPATVGQDEGQLWQSARDAALRLHRFKRSAELPRVRRVLGALRGLAPQTLVDIGSGRGTFLWPLVDGLPEVTVTAIDRAPHRVEAIECVRRGGIDRVRGAVMDVTRLALPDDSTDVVTVLEVLEHLERPELAAAEVVRVARRAVIASVPSKEDDNPEHIQLFDKDSMTKLFRDAGAERINIDFVLNHMVAIVILK
jgi:SAM-dependent methyltransferase